MVLPNALLANYAARVPLKSGLKGIGSRTALAAAFLLFFQALLSTFALGAGASAAPLDAFGNPICADGTDYAGLHGRPAPGHAKLPPCCPLGCQVLSGALGPVPDAFAICTPRLIDLRAAHRISYRVILPKSEHRPGSPRAPPLSV